MKDVKANPSKTLVFLPGWGFSAQVWSTVASHFTQTRLLDLPCLAEINLSAAVEALSQHIPEQSIIVAWSLGGLIATELCYRRPEKCSQLVLVASTPKFSSGKDWLGISTSVIQQMIQQMKDQCEVMMQHFFRLVQFPSHDRMVDHYLNNYKLNIELYDQWLRRYLILLFATDQRQYYSQFQKPLLHILGSKDAVIKTDVERLKRLNQNAHIEMIEGAGHIPFLTHQSAFIELLKAFLSCDAV